LFSATISASNLIIVAKRDLDKTNTAVFGN